MEAILIDFLLNKIAVLKEINAIKFSKIAIKNFKKPI